MHELNFREMTKAQLAEESLIDLAFAILEEKKVAIPFENLIKMIQEFNGYSDEEMKSRLVQFYTDLNVDGRFLLENDKGWGLREWYKVEQIEEETAPSVKARKKKSKSSVDEDELEELEEDIEEDDIVFEDEFEEDDLDEELDEELDEDLDALDEDKDIIEFDQPDDLEELQELDDEMIEEDDEFALEEDDEFEEDDIDPLKD